MGRVATARAVQAAVTASHTDDHPPRCAGAVVRVNGTVAGVAYRPDHVELLRRDEVGLGAITRRDVLDALMGLPVGAPVPVGGLSERERRLLRRAPHGAVEVHAGDLIRHAVAPIAVRSAVVAARSWQEGLLKAGGFAPLCSRTMLLFDQPDDLDDARVQASFYGVGICLFEGGSVRTLVDPEPYVRRRHTAAQWWFAEETYRQVIAASPGEPACSPTTTAVVPPTRAASSVRRTRPVA